MEEQPDAASPLLPPPANAADKEEGPSTTATLASRPRTDDVVSSAKSFQDLMVPEPLVRSLAACGFLSPSPVQQAAVPLGRMGSDLIVQAKSGTGKTVTFALICLERVKLEVTSPQALILAPTREIAIQSEQVITKLIQGLPEGSRPACAVFVGGLSVVADEKKLRRLVHIVVGTPGRVCALLQSGALQPGKLSMFVLDEADTLLAENFYGDVTWVYDQLPKRKQVMAYSATYTPELLADLEPLMKRPQRVMLCSETVSLAGVRQFYVLVGEGAAQGQGQVPAAAAPAAAAAGSGGGLAAAGGEGGQEPGTAFARKVQALLALLSGLSFHQAVVFCNHKPQAEWLAARLTSEGFPAAYLSGDRSQVERMEAMGAVRGFKLRVMVSTDVMARGVDLDRVNVVANLDLPHDAATYVHRVGRTGRFGSMGISVSYVTPAELTTLQAYLGEAQAGHVLPLPAEIPPDMYSFELGSEWERQALDELRQAPKAEAADQLPVPPPARAKKQQGGGEDGKAASAAVGQKGAEAAATEAGPAVAPYDGMPADSAAAASGSASGWHWDAAYGWVQYTPQQYGSYYDGFGGAPQQYSSHYGGHSGAPAHHQASYAGDPRYGSYYGSYGGYNPDPHSLYARAYADYAAAGQQLGQHAENGQHGSNGRSAAYPPSSGRAGPTANGGLAASSSAPATSVPHEAVHTTAVSVVGGRDASRGAAKAGEGEGEEEEHLRLDVLEGKPRAAAAAGRQQTGGGRAVEEGEGEEEEGEEEGCEEEEEEGWEEEEEEEGEEGDVPGSEDLEHHAANLIERLTVTLPGDESGQVAATAGGAVPGPTSDAAAATSMTGWPGSSGEAGAQSSGSAPREAAWQQWYAQQWDASRQQASSDPFQRWYSQQQQQQPPGSQQPPLGHDPWDAWRGAAAAAPPASQQPDASTSQPTQPPWPHHHHHSHHPAPPTWPHYGGPPPPPHHPHYPAPHAHHPHPPFPAYGGEFSHRPPFPPPGQHLPPHSSPYHCHHVFNPPPPPQHPFPPADPWSAHGWPSTSQHCSSCCPSCCHARPHCPACALSSFAEQYSSWTASYSRWHASYVEWSKAAAQEEEEGKGG